MKKSILIYFIPFLYCLPGCQKELSVESDDQHTTAVDSAIVLDNNDSLVIRRIDHWTGGATTIDSFEYDVNGKLAAEHLDLAGLYDTYYTRDSKQRITEMLRQHNGVTARVRAIYIDAGSHQLAYTLGETNQVGPATHDSTTFHYNPNGRVDRTTYFYFIGQQAIRSSYDEWSYDEKGNLSKLQVYQIDSTGHEQINIGYDFQYDEKINPFHSADDAILVDNWYISASPNNLIKQINHYGNGSNLEDDYIELSYEYLQQGRPSSSLRSGPAIGDSKVQSTYFYQ